MSTIHSFNGNFSVHFTDAVLQKIWCWLYESYTYVPETQFAQTIEVRRSSSKPTDVYDIVTLSFSFHFLLYEAVCEKTNDMGSDQVRHKPACTVTEDV